MTKDDRDMLIRIDEKVSDMHKTLYGNGNPGIVSDIRKMQINCNICKTDKEKTIKNLKWVIGVTVTLLAVYIKAKYNL